MIFKNQLESFTEKDNNPLQFENQIFIEVEESIALNNFDFEYFENTKNTIQIHAKISKEEYIKKVNALKLHIKKGDIYEINFCMTFEALNVSIDPLSIYQKLNSISNAPYSALAKFDTKYIISSSPELFLTKTKNKLLTKPIKGTAKRK